MFFPYRSVNKFKPFSLRTIFFHLSDQIPFCCVRVLTNIHMICWDMAFLEHRCFAALILLFAHRPSLVSWLVTSFKPTIHTTYDIMVFLICSALSLVELYSEMIRYHFGDFTSMLSWRYAPNISFHSFWIFQRISLRVPYWSPASDAVSFLSRLYH